MNAVVPFRFDQEQVRIIMRDGAPWFVGRDVAACLGYVIPQKAIGTHCKGVLKWNIPTEGGSQEMLIIPESDVYRLVMRSNAPHAEQFQDWVCEEVLPSIRKTGGYMTPSEANKALEIITKGFTENLVPIVQTLVDGQNSLRSEVVELKSDVNGLSVRFDRLENRIDRRTYPSTKTMMRHYNAVHERYGDKCPCCQRERILDEHGQPIANVCELDHWRLPSQSTVDLTWVVCRRCNSELRKQEVHHDREVKFAAYQSTRRDYEQEKEQNNQPLFRLCEDAKEA